MSKVIEIPYAPRPWQLEVHKAIESHRFSVLVVHRRGGKTVAMINHLIKQAVTTEKQAAHFAYIAPQFNQAKDIAWNYLLHYTNPIKNRIINRSELFVTLGNGAKIRLFGADNPDRLRGLYFDGVVLDEVAQMKNEVWGEVIRPALADRQGWAVFIGTPKGQNLLFDLYQQALKDSRQYAGTFRVDETNALPVSEVEDAKSNMSEAQFRQEFLCDFSASSDDVVIPLDVIVEATERGVTEKQIQGSEKIIGIDVARFGDDQTVFCLRQGVLYHKLLKYRKLSTEDVVARANDVINKFKPDAVFIDSGGGGGVIDGLLKLNHKVTEISFAGEPLDKRYRNKRAEMMFNLAKHLKRGACLPKDSDLIASLSSARYFYAPSSGKIQIESKDAIKKRIGRSPDEADALALTHAMTVQTKTGRRMLNCVNKSYSSFNWIDK